jgi:putative glycosyltransferase (TIGR04348 family)
MLRDSCKVIVQSEWDGKPADLMIALHAHRSGGAVARYREAHPDRPLVVMLTGTDLYRDLPESRVAVQSLDAAHRIVVLQEDAQRLLQPAWREKSQVIFQSARPLDAKRKVRGRLHCVAVGHLRDEKDPQTLFRAIERLPKAFPFRLLHIGAPLDESLGTAAKALARREPRYKYLGALPHGLTRSAIKAAHLLVHPSKIEGGANVVVESVMAGTPVIASRISGNLGLLGTDYAGYFEAGDASGLADRLVAALEDRRYLQHLERQCARRRNLFSPSAEARSVRRLVQELATGRR